MALVEVVAPLAAKSQDLEPAPALDGQGFATFTLAADAAAPAAWTVNAARTDVSGLAADIRTGDKLNPAAIEDLILVFHYHLS